MTTIRFNDFLVESAQHLERFSRWYTAENRKCPALYPLELQRKDVGSSWSEEAAKFYPDSAATQVIEEERKLHSRFFMDVNGVVYTVYPNGETNFGGDIRVEEANAERSYAQVQVLGDFEGGDKTGSRLVEDEYVLWGSMIELGAACL